MECYLVKDTLGILRPATEEDQQKIRSMKAGEEYKATVVLPRNRDHHRKFFSLMNLVFSNLPEHLTCERAIVNNEGEKEMVPGIQIMDDLIFEIKLQMHHFDRYVTLDGTVEFRPKSISFTKMDQDEFNKFYSRTIDIVLQKFLPGTNREALEDEVLRYI